MDIQTLTDIALRQLHSRGFESLSDLDQLLVTIWGVEADVNNGGFDQYYFNSYGDQARLAPYALRQIGANATADLVELANAAFGKDGPPSDRLFRQLVLDRIRDSAAASWSRLERKFWAYPDNIETLLFNYVRERNAA